MKIMIEIFKKELQEADIEVEVSEFSNFNAIFEQMFDMIHNDACVLPSKVSNFQWLFFCNQNK